MISKKELRQKLFDFVFAFWVIYYLLFKLSTFKNLFTDTIWIDWSVTSTVMVGLVIVIFLTNLRKREFVIVILLILLGVLNAYYMKDYTEPMLFMFLCAAKSIDVNVTAKKIYRILSSTFVLVVVFAFLGLIQNKASTGPEIWDNRIYLGFIHPNNCGAILLNLMLLKIYIVGDDIKLRDTLTLICFELVNFVGPKSKTSLILGAFVLVSGLVLNKLSNRVIKIFLDKLKYLPFILAGLSVVLVYLYYNNVAASLSLNFLLSTRVEQMAYFWSHYSITMFGQVLENISSSQRNTLLRLRGLDNGYLYMLIGKGIVFTIVFITLAIRSSIYFFRTRDKNGALSLVIILIWGLTETTMFRIEMNYLLLLLSKGIFESIKRIDYVKYKKESVLSNVI